MYSTARESELGELDGRLGLSRESPPMKATNSTYTDYAKTIAVDLSIHITHNKADQGQLQSMVR
jgi:hypothetical protein